MEVQTDIFKAAWFRQGDWTAHAELWRVSGQEGTGLFLGPANSFRPAGFCHVLNGCNTTRNFSWRCVPWLHLPLPIRMGWSAPSGRWRAVLKEDLSWEWGTSLRIILGKQQCLLAAKHGDNSVHYIHQLLIDCLHFEQGIQESPKLLRKCLSFLHWHPIYIFGLSLDSLCGVEPALVLKSVGLDWNLISTLWLASTVASSKLLNFSKPHFPHI